MSEVSPRLIVCVRTPQQWLRWDAIDRSGVTPPAGGRFTQAWFGRMVSIIEGDRFWRQRLGMDAPWLAVGPAVWRGLVRDIEAERRYADHPGYRAVQWWGWSICESPQLEGWTIEVRQKVRRAVEVRREPPLRFDDNAPFDWTADALFEMREVDEVMLRLEPKDDTWADLTVGPDREGAL